MTHKAWCGWSSKEIITFIITSGPIARNAIVKNRKRENLEIKEKFV